MHKKSMSLVLTTISALLLALWSPAGTTDDQPLLDKRLKRLARAADMFNSVPVIAAQKDTDLGRMSARDSRKTEEQILASVFRVKETVANKATAQSKSAQKTKSAQKQAANASKQAKKQKRARPKSSVAAAKKSKTGKQSDTIKTQSAAAVRVNNLGRVCKNGDSQACYRLGMLAIRKQRPKIAMRMYRRACELGEMLACRSLGTSMTRAGREKVANYFNRRACLLGDMETCKELGTPTP